MFTRVFIPRVRAYRMLLIYISSALTAEQRSRKSENAVPDRLWSGCRPPLDICVIRDIRIVSFPLHFRPAPLLFGESGADVRRKVTTSGAAISTERSDSVFVLASTMSSGAFQFNLHPLQVSATKGCHYKVK